MIINSILTKIPPSDFVKDISGFIYYGPSGFGLMSAHNLREIANELDRQNKPFEDILNNEAANHE